MTERRKIGRVADAPRDAPREQADAEGELRKWQVAGLTLLGAVALLLIAAKVSRTLALILWIIPTVVWLFDLVLHPEGAARTSARRRGKLATVAWAPFVGPFLVGFALWGIFDSSAI